jgi:hypothetical protein
MELDTSKAKATFVRWSITHPTLAVGTDKVINIYEREIYYFTIRELRKKYQPWENTPKKLFPEIGIKKDF